MSSSSGGFLKVLENEARAAQPDQARKSSFQGSHLEVRMFNVGHGEAILLIFPEKRAWLIDGGNSSQDGPNVKLGEGIARFLKTQRLTLEALVLSHPHKDHVGAVATVLRRAKSQLASSLSCYRSVDPTWAGNASWQNNLSAEFQKLGKRLKEIQLRDAKLQVAISNGVSALLFAGSGEGTYTSIFLQLRFHDASLLFTGDSHGSYEIELLSRFDPESFRADVLKVTNHGSNSGTARGVVAAIGPGIAIASTGEDSGHRLEADTLGRLGGHAGPRKIFETLVDGDIILRTDGKPYAGGVLYQVEFESPGLFSKDLGAKILPVAQVDAMRTSSHKFPAGQSGALDLSL